jgi:phosphoglycolate phosphatase
MPPAVKPPPLCIFDLDGTLVDSLRDIAEALNECLELLGLTAYPIDRYRYMVGEGVPKLCERAVGASHPHLLLRLIELARPRYRTRPLRHTRPYPGVVEMIEQLREAGVKFDVIQGYVEERHRKPDPYYVLQICNRLRASPSDTCMVGDTPTDLGTAQRSGALGIGVTWGFRSRADLSEAGALQVVDSPAELVGLLGCGA